MPAKQTTTSSESKIKTTHQYHPKVGLVELAHAIRFLAIDAVQKAKSGHPGMPMGMADVATVLFSEFLIFDPKHPTWMNRDRFVLSAGHGSMLLYAILYLTGYESITLDQIKCFRQLGAKTAGHPEVDQKSGIETTTGPLGQGLANAVGMALSERIMHDRFGADLIHHHTYSIVGDGCLMEGISQEAITFAGHLKLSNLIVLFDDNHISIDGGTELSTSEDQLKRFEAAGWDVQAIDGHDYDQIRNAISHARASKKPSFIACRTTIAFGSPNKAGSSSSHGSPLGMDEVRATRENLGWNYEHFEVPSTILDAWRSVGKEGTKHYDAWCRRLEKASDQTKRALGRFQEEALPSSLEKTFELLKKTIIKENQPQATRQTSGKILAALQPELPELIGGSADLSESNQTKTAAHQAITSKDYAGNYIHYGVREHGMAAIMNGLSLHSNFIPYGGTFLVFSDYCKPAMRLSALMERQVIYVMTHDSIGLGEDGPTHQPVEHLAMLRAIPNLCVFRPADAVETVECWQLALEQHHTPSVMVLTRQKLPLLRKHCQPKENLCARGAYVVSPADHEPIVSFVATGSEVEIAIKTQFRLKENNIDSEVISVPCMELFEKASSSYKDNLFSPTSRLRVGIEAASPLGWGYILGPNHLFVGMNSFGASAPAEDLYRHFGFDTEEILSRILGWLESHEDM